MQLDFLLAASLAWATEAYGPAPIRWGVPTSRLFLAPKFLLSSGGVVAEAATFKPQKLAIWDEHVHTSANDMPHFSINPDQTITWSGRCVEASGHSSGDAVRINRCDGGPGQFWNVLPLGRNSRLQLKDSSLCMDATHQEGGWHGAPIVLRPCDDQNSEFVNFADPIPRPTGSPSQSRPRGSTYFARLSMVSFFVLAMLLLLSLNTVRRQRRKKTRVEESSQGGVPVRMDQHGLALTLPVAFHRSSYQETVPAAMVTRASLDDDGDSSSSSDNDEDEVVEDDAKDKPKLSDMLWALAAEEGFLSEKVNGKENENDLPGARQSISSWIVADRLRESIFGEDQEEANAADQEEANAAGKGSLGNEAEVGLDSLRNFDLRPQEVVEYLNRYVIQQNDAKKVLAVALCDHYNHVRRQLGALDVDQQDYAKPNILLLGPTGVGKTYLMKTMARLIGVPFVKGDATKFSETGIVGQDAEDLVRDLVDAANGNTELAQYGIIYLDEVDKLAAGGEVGSSVAGRGPLTRGVQNNFLKLLEDTDVQLGSGNSLASALGGMMGRVAGPSKPNSISTRNILFIFSGAFTGMDAEIKRRKETRSLGFDIAPESTDSDATNAKSYLRYAETKDLVSAGLEPEFVGRVPVRVALDALTADNLKEILTRSEGSVLKQFIADFEGYGIDMKATDAALTEVATLADKENTGARGLVTVLERTLREHKYVLPSSSIKDFELDDATVRSPMDGLAALLTSVTEDDKVNARMDDLKRWEKRLKREVAPLQISVTDEAMDFLSQLSSQRDQGAYWFAMHRFEDLPALLKQMDSEMRQEKQQTRKSLETEVSIDLAFAQQPEEQFSKWRQIIENAKIQNAKKQEMAINSEKKVVFTVGQRVRCKKSVAQVVNEGDEGTVKSIIPSRRDSVVVEFGGAVGTFSPTEIEPVSEAPSAAQGGGGNAS